MEHVNGAAPADTATATTVADVPMPSVENMPSSVFRPAPGIGTADVQEIILMYLLHLTGSPITVAPGALRGIPLPAERVVQLSDSARRFMTPMTGSAVAAGADPTGTA